MLTRVEEVDARHNEGVDGRKNDVGLISNSIKGDRSNHNDHAGKGLAQVHANTTKAKLTS